MHRYHKHQVRREVGGEGENNPSRLSYGGRALFLKFIKLIS